MHRGAKTTLLCALFGASACLRCGTGELRQGGETPHVRCLAMDPPTRVGSELGGVSVALEGRVLSFQGLPTPTRIAAFSGPSLGGVPGEPALRALKASGAHLLLVLGGLGEDDHTAQGTAGVLASLGKPVLFLAGATDKPDRVARALAGQDEGSAAIVDVTALDAVRLGHHTLVPVAGANGGHYALNDESCGYGLADLKERAARLGEPGKGERRWLLAWGAPGGGGARSVARDAHGADLGVADLAELGRRLGAPGGLFAWPTNQLGSARDSTGKRALTPGEVAPDLRLVVPRLWGPPQGRGDGSYVMPSFAVLELREGGMAHLTVERVALQ